MNKATWNKVKINGCVESFVCVFNDREIGLIFKIDRNSAWVVNAGIGESGKMVGTNYGKAQAKKMLLSAPESFWKS